MKKAARLTVFLVVFIDMLGFGIVLPLMPFYAERFHASAVMVGFLYSIYSIAQLFFSPFWGSLSDRIGRRPVMIISTFGSSLSYLIFAFSSSLRLLFFSRLLAGMMGGNIATAQAYIADVTAPEDRAKGMGMLGAAIGIGISIGPSIATLFIHPRIHAAIAAMGFPAAAAALSAHAFTLLGLAAMTLSLTSFLMVIFWLPETVVPGLGASTAGRERAGVFSVRFWRRTFGPHRSPSFKLFAASAFLISLAFSSLYSAFPLFAVARLSLTSAQVGMQYGIIGIVAVVIQGGLIRMLVKRFREQTLFLFGTFLMIIGLALIPWSSSSHQLTAFLCFLAVGSGLNGPTLNSLVSKESEEGAFGATMGIVQGLSSLGRAVGPTWGGWLFGFAPALPFFATACVVSLPLLAGLKVLSAHTEKR